MFDSKHVNAEVNRFGTQIDDSCLTENGRIFQPYVAALPISTGIIPATTHIVRLTDSGLTNHAQQPPVRGIAK